MYEKSSIRKVALTGCSRNSDRYQGRGRPPSARTDKNISDVMKLVIIHICWMWILTFKIHRMWMRIVAFTL